MADNNSLGSLNMGGIKSLTADFKTGREEVLKTVAGTASNAVDVLTAFRSSIANSINSTFQELTGNLLDAQDLLAFVDFENGKLTLNQNELMRQVNNATGLNLDANSTLESMTDQIYNDINRYSNGSLGKIYDKNGNLVLFDSMMSGTEYYKLSSMVDSYLDNNGKERDNSYYDRFTNNTVGHSLIRQAAILGNYVDVQDIYDAAEDVDKPGYRDALAQSLKDVGNNGDFRTAAVICDIITMERATSILPKLLVALFKNYRLPSYLKRDEYPEESNRLISFSDLYQPGWRSEVYFDTETRLLTLWANTSAGLYSLFSHSATYAADLIMGRQYAQSTTMQLMKDKYPDLATVKIG